MPDTTPDLAADLIALQQAWNDAHAATVAFADSVEALRRSGRDAEPGSPLRRWTDEEDQQLDQYRTAEAAALDALWTHPAIVAAQKDGTWKALHAALKAATGAEGWMGPKK
ncbi:hypothetical protein [Streptacidiphilus cavernicola]|uniref:Uncharacterized protein n=1 Tax=Streptacidiphilus cavernicola TaxID=3342716 RepID=A0ABV6VXW3_9ACTN